jgi:hypothetical protein
MIADALAGDGGLLPEACKRRYEELEDLFCIACNHREPMYNNPSTKTLQLCKSFVMKLWGSQNDASLLNHNTTKFDRCGFKKPSYFENLTEFSYVYPSKVICC